MRALIASTVVSFVGAVWAALPGALVDRLPTWVVLSVPLMLGVLGLFGAYTSQPGLDE
ncbi:hypothetical protein [Paraburkholderia tropica]|uniref:hypothetical protein n=1 Tax=Paraburkholderia tropica TaxID=92647 RepID=UPI003D2ABE86